MRGVGSRADGLVRLGGVQTHGLVRLGDGLVGLSHVEGRGDGREVGVGGGAAEQLIGDEVAVGPRDIDGRDAVNDVTASQLDGDEVEVS